MKLSVNDLRRLINEEANRMDENVVRRFGVYLQKSPYDAKKYLWQAIRSGQVTESEFIECLEDLEAAK